MSLGKYVAKLKGLEPANEISDLSALYFLLELVKVQSGSTSALVDHLIALATADGDVQAVGQLNAAKADAAAAGTTAAASASAPVSGITADRPLAPATGAEYFDTTLGQPIWWDGMAWVDATGTPA